MLDHLAFTSYDSRFEVSNSVIQGYVRVEGCGAIASALSLEYRLRQLSGLEW
ncbi:hypothetical protein J6590_019945 [Homalodisca vitripennis]|nr:hypothetical protein J6590_019945 [Homalodisca vitripennis]